MKKRVLKNNIYFMTRHRIAKIISALQKEGNVFIAEIDAYRLGASFYALSRRYNIPPEILQDDSGWMDIVDQWPFKSGWLKEHGYSGYALIIKNFVPDRDSYLYDYYKYMTSYIQGNIELWGEGNAAAFNVFIERPLSFNTVSPERILESYRNFKVIYLDPPGENIKELFRRIILGLLIAGWAVAAIRLLIDFIQTWF